MRIDTLQEFRDLAHSLNFTAAAQRLNITQPNLSKHIADLEKELGFKLFIRGRELKLTPEGKLYLNTVAKLLYELDLCTEQCKQLGKGNISELVLQDPFIIDESAKVLFSATKEFCKMHPQISIDFAQIPSMTTIDALLTGRIDIGTIVCGGNPESFVNKTRRDNVVLEEIATAPLLAWAHRNNPIFKSDQASLKQLSKLKLMMPANRSFDPIRYAIHGVFEEKGLHPLANIYTVSSLQEFFFKANESDICLITPQTLLDNMLAMHEDMIAAPVTDTAAQVTFFIAYREKTDETEILDFVDIAAEIAQSQQ